MIHCLSAREQATEFKMSIKYDASHFMNGAESRFPLLPFNTGVGGGQLSRDFLPHFFVPGPASGDQLAVSTPSWLSSSCDRRDRQDTRLSGIQTRTVHSKSSDSTEKLKLCRSEEANSTKQYHAYNLVEKEKDLMVSKQKHSSVSNNREAKQTGVMAYNRAVRSPGLGYYDADYYRNNSSRSINTSGARCGRCSPYGSKPVWQYQNMNGRDLGPPMNRSQSPQAVNSVETRFIGKLSRKSGSFSPDKEDGMMEKDTEDGAINLSTTSSDTSPVIVNGNTSVTTNGENGHLSQEQGTQQSLSSQVNSKYIPISSGSSLGPKPRKHTVRSFSLGEANTEGSNAQSILMLAAQHGLSPQQMQQLLQQQQGTALPQQLQQMMHHQQSYLMQQQHQKVHEQMLHQLNEQLQLNVLQQSQLMQQEKGKSVSGGGGGKQAQHQIQQLLSQQQQLVQQIQQVQLQQRQYLYASLMQPFGNPQGMMSPLEMQQLWKEVAAQSGTDDPMKVNMNGIAMPTSGAGLTSDSIFRGNGVTSDCFNLPGSLIGQPQVAVKQEEEFANPLYRHGVCKWPGCDTACDDFTSFTKHLNSEHTLDDRNTAQARVQMQVVTQLEIQLTREKEMLHAMMQHLHMKPQRDRMERERERELKLEPPMTSSNLTSPIGSPIKGGAGSSLPMSSPPQNIHMSPIIPMPHLPPVTSMTSGLTPLVIPPPQPMLTSSSSMPNTPQSRSSSQPPTPTGLGPMRRRVSDKCNLPISAEIQRNREFYKNTDVRPPFTYASLIRQSIIESQNKQLTLNEVYQWFQNTFAYFRRNEATWKNAVRHNLSLHKCFMRVENVKGAVWTVDEVEFYKRRPQKLTGAISGSPSMTPDSSLYGDSINASLRAALEQSTLLLSQQHHQQHHQQQQQCNGSLSSDGAEDLSMRSQTNSNDSFSKSGSPTREEAMYLVKSEPRGPDEMTVTSPHERGYLGNHRDDQYSEAATKHYIESMVKHYSSSLAGPPYIGSDQYQESSEGGAYTEPSNLQYGPPDSDNIGASIQDTHNQRQDDEPMNQPDEPEEEQMTDSGENHQSEALNMAREAEHAQAVSNGEAVSPSSLRDSPEKSLSTNQEMFPPLLQTSNNTLAVVSHSISS